LKSNLLQPLNPQQEMNLSAVSTPSTFYVKTSEPLTLPTFKYPLTKHFCNRCDTPHSTPYELADFYENLGRQKTALQTSIYSHIDKQAPPSQFYLPSSNGSPAAAVKTDKFPNLQVHCRGLPGLKKLPGIATKAEHKSTNRKTNDDKKKEIRSATKPRDLALTENDTQTPLKLKYCTVKDLALKLPVQNKKLVWDFNLKTKTK